MKKTTILNPARVGVLGLLSMAAGQGMAQEADALNEIFVTATARPEARASIAATTQVIDRAAIDRSTAKSVTDLLAENAVGFFSEWTAAQTSINIRGATSDGQGRDYKGQVLVLVNGRRAGTANISKLSANEVERIEIVRGPASVIYGSQNMGGVINIIMKSGYNAPPSQAGLSVGSWGGVQANAQTSGGGERFDWYFGVLGGQRDDYESGKGGGKLANTGWERRGFAGALGFQVDERNRLELKLRTDGIYNAGFRGSGANTISKDDRTNASADLTYEGRTADERIGWMAQIYSVADEDEFKWASPVVRSGTRATPGTSSDYNDRKLDILGTRLQPRFKLGQGNDLLLGYDWERSRLRSDRFRVALPGGPTGQVAPYDNNQTEHVNALYFEDSQKFFDDRVTVRGGARRTEGRTSFDYTPNLPLQRSGSQSYGETTWSTGATWRALDVLNLRTGISTGFRAPTSTELGSDFTAVGGGRSFGNPNLKPESNRQIEFGGTLQLPVWNVDVALFQNTISDRIITVSRGPTTNTSDYANNAADIVVRGIEASANVDLAKALNFSTGAHSLNAYANGYYNFTMRDKGATALDTDRVQRMYKYEASLGLRYGRGAGKLPDDWSLQIGALLRGPMWYDTEEALLIPQGEPYSTYIHRKGAFTVWNLRGDYRINKRVKVFAAVNNLFDLNRSPIFIALDQKPCIADPRFQNGGCGTSMPGREFQVGMQVSF
ncbi:MULTISPECIES: TonB-dependent receptor [unclassified Variovorax]|uniref:TonB-dependent receptor n=1 Tax=unclassified Variovorax TaxID=663243 RepID=UPI0025770BB4|nr:MULTISPECIES: TonB-dependent receptor [unclassified Variovorax]MDM0089026.1 TonB-dependent receptor [Variovorax sp. J22G40]MDM0147099.1 TonB-dependent receptor [Variovorax sp. J2P1-31]